MISIRGVSKSFGRKPAVDNLTLEIPSGGIFALLGPNGAGKTTTIKMIAGLLRPDAGQIFVCGHDVQREHLLAKASLAYVPDEPFLYDKLTGREFLDFVGRMFRCNGASLRSEIDRWVGTFEMGAFIDDLTESYSHGMKQRLAISAALIHRPKVLMLDEPLVGLDPISARLVKDVFREQARSGVAVLMSTHILSIAQEVADVVGILLEGRLAALGSCQEIRAAGEREMSLEEAFFHIIGKDGGVPPGAP